MQTMLDKINSYKEGLRKLNSVTKYPSILTYHNLGPKGTLLDSLVEDKSFKNEEVYITEKIDGTNSRIVFFTDEMGLVCDYIIGSREDFLFAKGDRVVNPALGIVETVQSVADQVCMFAVGDRKLAPNSIYCLYGETYGGKINGAKQYTANAAFNVRFFDMFVMHYKQLEELMEMSVDQISSWREHGGQPFISVNAFEGFCKEYVLMRVPYICTANGAEIPTSLQDTWDWMQPFAQSVAGIDDGGLGNSEGVVIRTKDRGLIRKLRFEEYQKTKRIGLIN